MKNLLVIAVAAFSLGAQEPKLKRVPARSTPNLSGAELYRSYCAVCHGTDGKGNGPAAAAMKMPPIDLTKIAKNNGGKFPDVRTQRSIIGEDGIAAHGTADMPVWGPIFRRISSNPDTDKVRVYNLVKYIESIQVK